MSITRTEKLFNYSVIETPKDDFIARILRAAYTFVM